MLHSETVILLLKLAELICKVFLVGIGLIVMTVFSMFIICEISYAFDTVYDWIHRKKRKKR